MTLQTPTSKTTIYLDQPPSCLQFCPASPNSLVVGTYLLSETKSTDDDGEEIIEQKKTGSLQLWQLNPEDDGLTQLSRYAIDAAVFDLHFHPTHSEILAIATSAGCVSLFSVSETAFTLLWSRSVHEDPSIPALFLAWTPKDWFDHRTSATADGSDSQSKEGNGFAVTFSDGQTSVFRLDRTDTITEREEDSENEPITELGSFLVKQPIEVWFVAMDSYTSTSATTDGNGTSQSTPYLFIGDDFGTLTTRRFTDVPSTSDQDDEETSTLPPALLTTSDKALHHTSGVTSILPLQIPLSSPLTNGSPLLLTGSYDESLRLYHATRGGDVLAETGLGGGVWRLQVVDTKTSTSASGESWTIIVLASCMHAGTRVVRVTVGCSGKGEGEVEAGIEVLAEFTEHESMNYASDFWKPEDQKLGDAGSELRVVSSSFYDRRVCVWRAYV